jgi:hypothetical protein
MVNRPAGADRSKKWERAPYDWYRESPRVVEQLFHGLAAHGCYFDDDLIWDPCCGVGNVLDVAKRYGHLTFGSDIVDRHPRHPFQRGNILTQIKAMPTRPGRQTSLISNTPYSYEDEIAERIMTRVLEVYPVRRAAFIVPIAFLASQDRWGPRRLLRWRPSHVCIYRERHTMPPGHLIDQMAKPFDGGMADYAVVVFTRPHRWRTETVWLPPGSHPHPPQRRAQ